MISIGRLTQDTLALLISATTLVSSCEYMRALTFSRDERSGVSKPQYSHIYLTNSHSTDNKEQLSSELLSGYDSDLKDALKLCVATPPRVPTDPNYTAFLIPLLIPVIGFAIQQGISYVSDELASRVEELEDAGQRSYSARVILNSPDILVKQPQCLIFVRSDVDAPLSSLQAQQVGLIFVLKLATVGEPTADAFFLQPLFLGMKNAVAVTGKNQPIKLSFAVVGRAAYVSSQRIRNISVFGEETFSISNVILGDSFRTPKDSGSGLLALPPPNATSVEIAIAVTESGTAIPSGEKARSEMKALSEAVGPAISKEVTNIISSD